MCCVLAGCLLPAVQLNGMLSAHREKSQLATSTAYARHIGPGMLAALFQMSAQLQMCIQMLQQLHDCPVHSMQSLPADILHGV